MNRMGNGIGIGFVPVSDWDVDFFVNGKGDSGSGRVLLFFG